MCEGCTLHGTEDRCLTCRPRRTREERRERQRNAVKRSPWMHCEACGYVGPRFERVVPPTRGDLVTIAALLVFACVIGVAVAVLTAFRGSRQLSCPRCGATDSLWPATERAGQPLDPAFEAATSTNAQALRGRRRTGLLVVGVAVLLGALAVVLLSGRLRLQG